jgi:dipeptidyl aminopeptidase/acylaminoacyl peptidase
VETPVVIPCKNGRLVGILHLPEGKKRGPKCAAALFLHGFGGTKCEAHRMFVKTARALAARKIGSLRFDFRGAGDSSGDFEDITIRSQLEDALVALDFLRKQPRTNALRIGVLGMSTGGAVAAHMVGRDKKIKAAVLWSAVAEGTGILDELSTPESVASLAQSGLADYEGNLVGLPFVRQFAEMKPLREIAKSKCPVLIIHGSRDERVPVQHAHLYEQAALKPGRLVRKYIIEGADHSFNHSKWETPLVEATVDWFSEML